VLSIKDKLFVSLKVDGTEVEYANLVNIITCEGNGALIPTIKISLTDPTSAFSSDKALTEGNEIEISFAKSPSDNQVQPRKYRIFTPDRNNKALNPSLVIVGYLDAPDYITRSARESYVGTSESVISAVAAKCGLSFSGPSSFDGRTPSDYQTWLNVCCNRASFIQHVTKHGWMDEFSGMSTALTSYGEVRYRNLIDLINTPVDRIRYVFVHNAASASADKGKTAYVVKDARDSSLAGLMCNWRNYGSTRVQNMLRGEYDKFKELQVKIPGSYLPINKEVADRVERARIEYAPLDCGNVHRCYEQSKYQNIKLNALFSERVSILLDQVSEVQLYDVVVYRQQDADPQQPIKNTDIYIVVGKTQMVSGGTHYAERIELKRMSLTMKGTADLEVPGNGEGERSMVPDVSIDMSSINIAADNQRVVSTLSKILQGVEGATSLIDALKSVTDISLSSLQGVLDDALGDILHGTMSQGIASDLLGAMTDVLGNLVSTKSVFDYAVDTSANLIREAASLPSSVASAMLSKAGGLTSSIASQYIVSLPYRAATSAVSNLINRLPADTLLALPAYSDLHSAISQSTELASACTALTNNQWNSTLSVIQGLELPENYGISQYDIPTPFSIPAATPQISINIMQGLANPSFTDSMLQDVLHTGLRRAFASGANWQPPNSINPVPVTESSERSVALMRSYLSRLQRNI